jgi:hypothetical protein
MSKVRPSLTAAEAVARESKAQEQNALVKSLKAQLKVAVGDRRRLESQLSALESVLDHGNRVHRARKVSWLTPRSPSKGHHAILNLMLTDTHFDEVVDRHQVDGINAYDRRIAEIRLELYFKNAVKLAKHYLSGVTYDGASLMLGGDIFSGNIHEELQRTNADTLFGSLLYWLDPVEAGLLMLADEFGRVDVSGVAGNHGRQTRKPVAKMRAQDNLDWLFYSLLARKFKNDDRFTWNIPTAADAHVQCYSTKYLLTHGDQFKGGSGIAGALSPLMIGAARKTRREAWAGRPFHYMAVGHWHTSRLIPGVIMAGSVKGYDEYAYVSNFEPEPPQQPLWLTTPERGISFSAPVVCGDRKLEGW